MRTPLYLLFVFALAACAAFDTFSFSLKLREIPGKAPTAQDTERSRRDTAYRELGPGQWTDKLAPVAAGEKEDPTLINGPEVDRRDYPEVQMIKIGNSGCTGTVVGPRALLTAGHCGDTGDRVTFTPVTGGGTYSGVLEQHPSYPREDIDGAIAILDREVTGFKPASIWTKHFEKKGLKLQLIGYGCVNPGGGGGNDGKLRSGLAEIIASDDYDIVSGGGAALCYGDSGGPVFYTFDGRRYVVGINSKGNIKDKSYTTRLTEFPPGHARAGEKPMADFLAKWSRATGAGICGLTLDCGEGGGGETPPEPEQDCGPRQTTLRSTDGTLTLQAIDRTCRPRPAPGAAEGIEVRGQ